MTPPTRTTSVSTVWSGATTTGARTTTTTSWCCRGGSTRSTSSRSIVTTALLAGMIGWLVGDAAEDDAQRRRHRVPAGHARPPRAGGADGVIYLELPGHRPRSAHGRPFDPVRAEHRDRPDDPAAARHAASPRRPRPTRRWRGWAWPTSRRRCPAWRREAQLDELGQLQRQGADQLFVDLMIAHHEGGHPHGRGRRRAAARTTRSGRWPSPWSRASRARSSRCSSSL